MAGPLKDDSVQGRNNTEKARAPTPATRRAAWDSPAKICTGDPNPHRTAEPRRTRQRSATLTSPHRKGCKKPACSLLSRPNYLSSHNKSKLFCVPNG